MLASFAAFFTDTMPVCGYGANIVFHFKIETISTLKLSAYCGKTGNIGGMRQFNGTLSADICMPLTKPPQCRDSDTEGA